MTVSSEASDADSGQGGFGKRDRKIRLLAAVSVAVLCTGSPVLLAQNETAVESGWQERLSFSGDARLRHEYLGDEGRSETTREVIRLRLGGSLDLSDNWSAHTGLTTGDEDPLNSNLTLGDRPIHEDIRLDYAYVSYEGFEHTTISAGKHENVFISPAQLIYDPDYRPEGLGLEYENGNILFNAGVAVLDSDTNRPGREIASLWGAQFVYRQTLAAGGVLTSGISYYDAAVEGLTPFYDNSPGGNTVDAGNAFVHDYQELDLLTTYRTTVRGFDLNLFGHIVRNVATGDDNFGWLAGATGGRGIWELRYRYQDRERDAAYGPLVGTTFGSGNGATGHYVAGFVDIFRDVTLGLTYYRNDRDSMGRDFERLQFDLSASF